VPASPPRSLGGRLELLRDVCVGLDHRCGAMPGATVGIDLAGERLGQRNVSGPTLHRGRGLVHGRTHERVSKHDRRPGHRDQSGLLGGRQRVRRDPELLCPAYDRGEFAAVVSGRDDQELLRRLGKPTHPLQEQPFGGLRQRQRRRERLGPGELFRAEGGGELDQRERVPGGSVHDHVADRRSHLARGGDELTCCLGAETRQFERWQVASFEPLPE
jgi:hypothetical protein